MAPRACSKPHQRRGINGARGEWENHAWGVGRRHSGRQSGAVQSKPLRRGPKCSQQQATTVYNEQEQMVTKGSRGPQDTCTHGNVWPLGYNGGRGVSNGPRSLHPWGLAPFLGCDGDYVSAQPHLDSVG